MIQADFGCGPGTFVNSGSLPLSVLSGNPSVINAQGTGDFYFSRPMASFLGKAGPVSSGPFGLPASFGGVSALSALGELQFPRTMDGRPGKLVIAALYKRLNQQPRPLRCWLTRGLRASRPLTTRLQLSHGLLIQPRRSGPSSPMFWLKVPPVNSAGRIPAFSATRLVTRSQHRQLSLIV